MIVGFGHLSRAGKDTAARALSRDLQYKQVAFADPLRNLALEADPLVTASVMATNVGAGKGHLSWVVHGMTWEGAKDSYPEVRRFLINLGEGARKVFGEDFWVQQALRNVKKGDRVVFSDVRYPNEAEAIQKLGGKLIRIDRPGMHAQGSSDNALNDFDDWDLVIENNGTVMDLERTVVDAVKGWIDDES
jgi:hypothetical protein